MSAGNDATDNVKKANKKLLGNTHCTGAPAPDLESALAAANRYENRRAEENAS